MTQQPRHRFSGDAGVVAPRLRLWKGDRGAWRGSVVSFHIPLENGAGCTVNLIFVFITVADKFHIINHPPVVAVELGFFEVHLRRGQPCVLQRDFRGYPLLCRAARCGIRIWMGDGHIDQRDDADGDILQRIQ